METKFKTATESEGDTAEQLRKQAGTVRDDVKELGRLTRDYAQEKLEDTRQKAGDTLTQKQEDLTEAKDALAGYVRQQPMKSMLIASGAGVLLGLLFASRR